VEGRLSLLVSNSQYSPKLTAHFSFDRPIINSTKLSALSSSGGVIVELNGLALGLFGISATCRLGRTSSESATWNSDSTIMCKCSGFSGPFSSIAAFVSVASNRFWQQTGSLTGGVSYRMPALMSFSPSSVASTGVQSVTVFGQNFAIQGRSSRVRSFFSSSLASVWVSDSSLIIKVASGSGLIPAVFASFQGEASVSTAAFSYASAAVQSTHRTNQPSTGSSVTLLTGSSFGTSAYTLKSSIGSTASQISVWNSDSFISLKSSIGIGSDVKLTLSIGKLTSFPTHLCHIMLMRFLILDVAVFLHPDRL